MSVHVSLHSLEPLSILDQRNIHRFAEYIISLARLWTCLGLFRSFFMFAPQSASFVARWRHVLLVLSTCLLLSSFFLVSCSGLNFGGGNSTPTAKPTPSQVGLTKLHWCNKPFIVFRDEHAPVTVTPASGTPSASATSTSNSTPVTTVTSVTTVTTVTTGGTPTATATTSPTPTTPGQPTTITDWSQIEPNLGFTVYLPATLPAKTCLVSVSGTVHDPIFGGNFIIGYLLPDGSPLSLSEAPMRTNSRDFQCTSSKGTSPQNPGTPGVTPGPTQIPILLCTGAKDTTDVVFSMKGSEESLKKFFDALQPNVEWAPVA